MHPATSRVLCASTIAALLISGGCGGSSDGGPVTVASVLITAPLSAPTFGTLGRQVQFAAVAKDAGGGTITTATITWSSTNTAVATVSGGGLVTAAGNGTTSITASSGSITSTGVTVTVSQVANSMQLSPATIAFGAIGSTQQVTATLFDSAVHPMTTPAPTFTNAASGKTSVNSTGLVTALGNTSVADSIIVQVNAGGTIFSSQVVVTVQQVATTVTVSSTGIDTLKTTGNTKQYSAAAADSNAHPVASATFTWSSTATSAATVNSSTGLAMAQSQDGTPNITATTGSVSGVKALVVRHVAKTFSLSPNTAQSIATAGGTIVFTGTAQDSALTSLTITWTSRNTAVLTMSPASGTSGSTSTATAKGNGTTFVVLSGGTRADSAQVATSNQLSTTASVNVGDDFFASVTNSSNPASDTIAVNGTVTWTWVGSGTHNVTSDGSPSFTSSGGTLTKPATYSIQFTSAGTYTYHCTFHGLPGSGMWGKVVVK